MLKPRALVTGDVIALVSPSSPSPPESFDKARAAVEGLGFRVKPAPGCREALGYLAGPDEVRARDINEMFADPEVKGIFCLRGGDGATRILDRIDARTAARNPKVFLGYSDITVLHAVLNKKAKLCTFHGPMPASDFTRKTFSGYVSENLLKALCKVEPLGDIHPHDSKPLLETLVPGVAEGELVGGNLALVCSLLGTPWEIDTRGKILILEDTDEPPYRIDRMLTQLRLAGKLHEAAGIFLGQFTNVKPKNPKRTFTLREIFETVVAPVGRPTLLNGCFGHGDYKVTLPLGARARIGGDVPRFTILEAGVC
ncbi:MAG: LD-carboxypeptidase [Thermovirgaceae bacterium]